MKHLSVAATLVLMACGSGTQPNLGDEFSLGVGERAAIPALALSVRFVAVPDDSRCPSRAQCIWAGDAMVLLETAPLDGDAKTDTLHTNPAEGPDSLDWGTAVLRLIRLDPYPETPGTIAPDAYVTRLVADAR